LEIIPAIDLREGACTRVFGDDIPSSIYTNDPFEQAIFFKQAGAKKVHITDLDASFCGHPCNLDVIKEIVDYSGLQVQLAGGVRSMKHIDTLAELGVSSIVLGVPILRDPALTKEAVAKYGARIIPGIDGRDGMVAIEGFETSVSKSVVDLFAEIRSWGISRAVYTDLRRYATMKGPNFEAIQQVMSGTDMGITIAGGISEYDAVKKLRDMGVEAVIIGKALYSGTMDLQKTIEIGA